MDILKTFRESMELTQVEFAASIGVSASLYIKIELRKKETKQGVYCQIEK